MNTIKIYLAESGRVADLKKDFPLYQGQYQNKLLNIYVPTSILSPDFKILSEQITKSEYVAGTAVKIGMTLLTQSGETKVSKNYYMRYIKTLVYQNVEYALFERKLPQEFTLYSGQGYNAPVLTINVVNVETDTDPVKILSIITSQNCSLDVMPSSSLDNDEAIDPTELEEINARLNAIDQILPAKQDKTDAGLNTNDKTVVGAINELKTNVDTNTTNIAKNTEDIAKNTNDIDDLKQKISTGENYIGTLQWESETLPTNEELNAFVEEKVAREPKNGDVVILIQKLEDKTDKNFKYIFSASNWMYYEIPPMEQASNGTFGIIEGTYSTGSENETLVDISGGQILNIYIKDSTGEYRNIKEYINANGTAIENIVNGTTSVGIALKAIADGLGNNIVDTYITQAAGATKEFVRNYALSKNFNEIYYLSKNGYFQQVPTDTDPQFSLTVSSVGETELFSQRLTIIDYYFQLTTRNSASNSFFISANRDCVVTFKLTTEAMKWRQGGWRKLAIELSNPVSLKSGQIQKIDFSSIFSMLGTEVIDLGPADFMRQTLAVITQESTSTTFDVYSNQVYPSVFTLNTMAQVVYHTTGYLGENPVFELSASGDITSSGVSFIGSEDAQLYNNVECQVIMNIPASTVGYESFNEDMSILGIELGGLSVRLATPYNFQSGVPTFKNLRQVNHTQDAVNGITYTMKCFIKIDSGDNVTFIVDEDNLEDFADKEYVELTAPKEIFMGADGVEETNVYNFTVQNSNSFIDYRTNKTKFLLDLHLPVAGSLTLTKEVAITFGDTVYYLYNILKGNDHVTIGDLKQVDKYNNATGYRFIFHATFFQNSDITGFAIIPTISMSDILALTSDEMDAYMADGGLTDGQLAICSSVGDGGGYDEGYLYKFSITYPATYTWNVLTQKGTTVTVNNVKADNLNFTSDPQTQINNILNNSKKISNTNGGFAGGRGSSTDSGGAIGLLSTVIGGGAVGESAFCGDGFAGGYKAKCLSGPGLSGRAIDAVQLGTGINNKEKSLQVYDDNIYDSVNHELTISKMRIGENEVQVIVRDSDPTTSTVGIVDQVYLNIKTLTLFKCTAVTESAYTWQSVPSGIVNIELDVPSSATSGTLTSEQLAVLQSSDSNGIIFDHEYYKMSTKGKVEGYRTYYNVERENGDTSIKTITITESTLAWVLYDTNIDPKPTDETYTVTSAMWRALSGNAPFQYMASVTATYTIGSNTEVGIVNDQPTLFANYGFVVGSVSNQTVIIFALSKPAADVNLSVRFRG